MRRINCSLFILRLLLSKAPFTYILHTVWTAYTVQLGNCDSDVTVCLLFWNMPIIQDRDVKYPYKRYEYYLQAF